MTITLDILVEDDRWEALGLPDLAHRAARIALEGAGIGEDVEISILAADDARIAALNEQHRGKAGPTNVLSWPAEDLSPDMPGEDPYLPSQPEIGDIALAWDTCAREAEAAGIAMSDHVTHLVVHGVLHLLGYDHITDEDAAVMEEIEVKALETIGIQNPYS